jgi:hypothetical protein
VNDEITVDVLPGAAGRSWDELKHHIIAVDIDGVTVKVQSLRIAQDQGRAAPERSGGRRGHPPRDGSVTRPLTARVVAGSCVTVDAAPGL